MLRKIGLAALVIVAAIAGAGVAFRLQGSALPGFGLPPLPGRLVQVAAAHDSVAAAELALKRCRLLIKAVERRCYEDFLLALVQRDQMRLAIGALTILGERDPYVRRFGHDFAHVIGINAWKPGTDIGPVYRQCNELFQSGCYHGVIQAYFSYGGTDSAKVVNLCRDGIGVRDNYWLRFQCVHGIGHGLVQTYAMNLPQALAGCDRLGNPWDAESCYGGAFMEFIVGGRGQSHHPHASQAAADESGGAGEHAGHRDPEPVFPPFKVQMPSDPLYPCSALGERYQRSCYQMQAGLIAEVTGLDFRKVAQRCDLAPERWRPWCYQGIGTYVSGVTVRDPAQGTEYCSLGDPRYRPWCFVGLVKNFVDVTTRLEDGLALCRRLGPQDIATACYVAVGEEAAVLLPAMDRRERACAAAEPQYAGACRFGAGLSPDRPLAYPIR